MPSHLRRVLAELCLRRIALPDREKQVVEDRCNVLRAVLESGDRAVRDALEAGLRDLGDYDDADRKNERVRELLVL